MNQRYQIFFKIIIILVILVIILKLCLIFLWPFIISLFISFFIEPIVKSFCNKGLSRKISVGLTYFFIIVISLGISFYISKYMYDQLIMFLQNTTSILTVISERFKFLKIDKLNYDHLIDSIQGILISYKSRIFYTVLNTFNGFLNLIMILLCSLFLSMDFTKLIKIGLKFFPENTFSFFSRINAKINKMIKLECQLICITTIQTVIGLYILGINNSLTIGIICGILDLLPIVGPAFIFIPLVIYEFIMNHVAIGIGLILLYILLQVIREVLKIKLVGENLNIHPVATIISLYVGILLFGISGLVFGPLLVVIIIELFYEYTGRSRFS